MILSKREILLNIENSEIKLEKIKLRVTGLQLIVREVISSTVGSR
jgi:hypothetical protein